MTTGARFRIVLDTNQIISAGSRWMMLDPLAPDEGNDAQQLIYLVAMHHTGLISSHIAAEYVRKLIDRGHPVERTTRYLGFLLATFEKIDVTSVSCTPAPTDPDDLMFLLCALDGNADLLISEDKHLLGLRVHYRRPEILPRSEVANRLFPPTGVLPFRIRVRRSLQSLRTKLRRIGARFRGLWYD